MPIALNYNVTETKQCGKQGGTEMPLTILKCENQL